MHRECVRTLVLRRSPWRARGARGKNKENTLLFTYLFSYLRIHIQHNAFTAVAPEGPRSKRKKQRKYDTIYVSLFLLKDTNTT